ARRRATRQRPPPAARLGACRDHRQEPSMTTTDWHAPACILCECNCGIEVQLEDRTLARIRGDRAHPGTQGYTCNKAMRLDLYQNGPPPLAPPLRRTADGDYEEIDWDTAIAEIAAGFAGI